MSRRLLTVFAVAILVVLGCGQWLRTLGALLTAREQVEAAWVPVEHVLQEWHHLTLPLTEALLAHAPEQFALGERLLELDRRCEAAATRAARITAAGRLGWTVGLLQRIGRRHPSLREDATYLTLQRRWDASARRLAVHRAVYNEAVRQFNRRRMAMPARFLAHDGRLAAAPLFEPAPLAAVPSDGL